MKQYREINVFSHGTGGRRGTTGGGWGSQLLDPSKDSLKCFLKGGGVGGSGLNPDCSSSLLVYFPHSLVSSLEEELKDLQICYHSDT